MTDLHYLSATEVLHAFRARELSPVEVFDAVAARADAVEPTVNALLERDHEDFRARPSPPSCPLRRTGEPPRPLEGAADRAEGGAADHRPLAAASGSLLTEGLVAQETHPVAERVYAAGAIVHARTTTPEFSCAGFTHSALWGVTRNPWNPDFTPGGSSGGSGASLAAGDGVPGDRLGHRRVDPDPGFLLRRRRVQGALRTGARRCRRSTSTPTATTVRWAARSPTSPCSTT